MHYAQIYLDSRRKMFKQQMCNRFHICCLNISFTINPYIPKQPGYTFNTHRVLDDDMRDLQSPTTKQPGMSASIARIEVSISADNAYTKELTIDFCHLSANEKAGLYDELYLTEVQTTLRFY